MRACRALAVAIVCSGATCVSYASVVLDATRLIYREGAGSISILATNGAALPSLVEARILDAGHKPTSKFQVVPPVARIDPSRAQHFRIFITAPGSMPQDRETLFWLTVLDIPPRAADDSGDGNYLQFAVRSNLKVFYRPRDLQGTPEEAARGVIWRAPGEHMTVKNPSRYFVTMTNVALDGVSYAAEDGPVVMVPPGAELQLHRQLKGMSAGAPAREKTTSRKVEYEYIDDYGAARPVRAEVGE